MNPLKTSLLITSLGLYVRSCEESQGRNATRILSSPGAWQVGAWTASKTSADIASSTRRERRGQGVTGSPIPSRIGFSRPSPALNQQGQIVPGSAGLAAKQVRSILRRFEMPIT
jgi:hypothetical protein